MRAARWLIDTFRAFTTAAVALANGATRIIMVATVEEALALRAAETGAICMGEVRGLAPDAFDYGNSPFEIATVNLNGRTITQRTSAATQGIVAASTQADRLYAASLVTAEATVRALLSVRRRITLVAMGDNGTRTDEDEHRHSSAKPARRTPRRQAGRKAVILAGGGCCGFMIRPARPSARGCRNRPGHRPPILPSGSGARTGDRSPVERPA
jgi:2-phosphosulfolactate phosphatase